jgi:hypothetical protein
LGGFSESGVEGISAQPGVVTEIDGDNEGKAGSSLRPVGECSNIILLSPSPSETVTSRR